jgi:hypothetical protein
MLIPKGLATFIYQRFIPKLRICFGSRGSGVRIPPPRPTQLIDYISDIPISPHASAFSYITTVGDFETVDTSRDFQLHFRQEIQSFPP